MIDQGKQSEEAKERGICHTSKECKQMYEEIDQRIKDPALKILRERLEDQDRIREAFKKDRDGWYVRYHFTWGMSVRNILRQEGFGEGYFSVHNLDDIYVALVEEALGLGL